ncbi:MAG: RNase adapter RapZ [Actinomycetaceae bacterium]|nr:RNase adapter RapZ [Actinomycetaceae bacterium]
MNGDNPAFDETDPITVPTGIPALDEKKPKIVSDSPELLIITGMSGAGRSRAGDALEDLDWYVVDNLPPHMLRPFVGMMTPDGGGVHRLAAVVDVRSGDFFRQLFDVLAELKEKQIEHRLIFLDADDNILVRRYEQVRRPHPLQGNGRILDGIRKERALLEKVRQRADVLIDTSCTSVHELARHMRDVVADEADRPLKLSVMSFGFKRGIPLDADHVVDVRFLSNPYWVSELRHLRGIDKPVRDYVLSRPGARQFGDDYVKLLTPVLSGYLNELKPYVTVAIGCTGGQHRSVAMAEYIAKLLREQGFPVKTIHRDMGLE